MRNAAASGQREHPVLEDREVEHRRPHAGLDEHEQRQEHGRSDHPPITAGESQPDSPPLETPNTRPVRPIRNVACRSRQMTCRSSDRSTRAAPPTPRRRRAAPNGTLNQNTQCQEMSTSAPPSTGPITSPTAATIVLVPIATPSCSRGNASVTIAAALANRKAPPRPCRIRQTISSVPLPAKPAPSEAAANAGSRLRTPSCDRTGRTAARR